MTRMLMGALAGITATTAMTAAMVALHRRLPASEQYPLPPRELTQSILGQTAAGGREEAEVWRGRTLMAHYVYGAASGALFSAARGPKSGAIGPGVAYGLTVWVISYMGWIPALRLLRPAHRHPPARNAVMLLAHAVWGASLALSLRQLLAFEASIAGGFHRDRPHHASPEKG